MKKSKYKAGDIVLVRSRAGDAIPDVHVKLISHVVVKHTKGKYNGFKWSMDWPGYSGWEATLVYQEEIDFLRKEWSIPFTAPEKDITWVYDDDIIKKPRNPIPNIPKHSEVRKNKNIITRKKRKKRNL